MKETSKGLFTNEKRTLFHLYNDWEFKYVYGSDTPQSKKALIALLNMILDRKDDPIVDVAVKNPIIPGKTIDSKGSVFDIRAETDSGEQINIEMQNGNLSYYPNRSVYYGGRMMNLALDNGQDYDKLKKSIVISIIKGNLFPDSTAVHSIFRPMEISRHTELTDKIQWHFIEIDKANPDKPVEEMDAVEEYSIYLNYANDESKEEILSKLLSAESEVLTVTETIFKEMTEDEKLIEKLEDEKRGRLAYNTDILAATERGKLEMALEIAKSLKSTDMKLEQIAEISGLTMEQIEKL